MALILLFAFVAGTLTVLSPCTLPVVPLLVGSATGGGRRRVVAIAVGFAATFVGTTVVLASALAAAGLTTDRLRLVSAALLAIVGAVLVVPALGSWAERRLAPVARLGTRMATARRFSGFVGGLVLGGAIGLIWAPCVGPIMAAVIAVAATSGPTPEAAFIAVAYVAGALLPLSLIAGAAQTMTRAVGSPGTRARIQRGLGGAMVVAALLVATGLDLPLQAAAADLLPDGWGTALVAVEDRPAVADQLDALAPTPTPAPPELQDLGLAPELTGITDWINSGPLTLASLRGKVVLVHFWTFACINCIHVQPYVKAWYDTYQGQGFVVIGVHTPELSFERDVNNVRTAVADQGVRFPVAFDPAYATWHAYGNHYWPAFYFIDREGRIRYKTAGEGGYAKSEAVIRELLAEPG
jgi:cytochrome c biogenesis protein CcdA/thiol-disulfide isomerase/thioredoxin